MQIKHLSLRGFRNYDNVSFDLDSNRVFIYGNNGSGKTNILEAISYLSMTRSMKKAEDKELIKTGNEFAYFSTIYLEKETRHLLECTIEEKKRSFVLDDVKKKTSTSIIGNLLTINYDPTMVFIFKEDPSVRRRLLDETISMIDSQYMYSLGRYKKYIKERNQALTLNYDPDVIDVLTLELIQSSYRIMVLRKRFIERLNTKINEIFKRLDKSEREVKLCYRTNVTLSSSFEEYIEDMKKLYKEHVSEEVSKKVTMIGIHRDDLLAEIDGLDLGSSGSQGQNRLVTIAIKFATAELINEIVGNYPILLLDDIFSDLDNSRLKRLLKEIENYPGQVFVTSCIDSEEVINWERLKICENQVRRL